MKELYQRIIDHLAKGGAVMVCTVYQAKILKSNHADRIKLVGNDLYICRGKNWDCINYCQFKFSVLPS